MKERGRSLEVGHKTEACLLRRTELSLLLHLADWDTAIPRFSGLILLPEEKEKEEKNEKEQKKKNLW